MGMMAEQEWLNNNRGSLDDLFNRGREFLENNRDNLPDSTDDLEDLLNRGREFLNENSDSIPDWMRNIEEQFGPMPSWMEQVACFVLLISKE